MHHIYHAITDLLFKEETSLTQACAKKLHVKMVINANSIDLLSASKGSSTGLNKESSPHQKLAPQV